MVLLHNLIATGGVLESGVENVNHQFGEGRDDVVGEFGGDPTDGFGDEDAIVDF